MSIDMYRIAVKHLNIILLLLFVCLSEMVQAQMSGSGTSDDPYLIKTPDDLFDIRNNLNACYKMANDIDLTEWIAEENPTNGWAPIDNFAGTFDGDGHTISGLYVNRPSESYGGLFGNCSSTPVFKNVVFLNPVILSKNYAGALVGSCGGTITNIKVIGGDIESNRAGGITGDGGYINNNVVVHSIIRGGYAGGGITSNIRINTSCYGNVVLESEISGGRVGGVVGSVTASYTISENYVSGILKPSMYGGGIETHSSDSYKPTDVNNRFDGIISGKGSIAGISPYYSGYANNNIVTGIISGTADVYGISPATTSNNICSADSLVTTSSSATIARIGNSGTNYAYNGMVTMKNGEVQTVNDGGVNGTSYSLRMLKRKSTYTALSYDFDNTWDIVEGVTLPYLKIQSTPATIVKCFGGENCILTGTATGNGTIYVFVEGEMTTGKVTDGKWSVSLGNVAVGTTVKVTVETEGKAPSIITTAVAADPSEDTTERCATPTVSYVGGKLHFSCATEGVTYHYNVTNGSAAEQTGNDNELSSVYTVTVYASKEGCYNSETATAEINLAGKKGDVNGDGNVTALDASLILQYVAKMITW